MADELVRRVGRRPRLPGPPSGAGRGPAPVGEPGVQRRRAALALGRRAEELVAARYAEAGFSLERNWRCRLGELDLVARRGRLLVVCEVKARTSLAGGAPAESVGPAKRRRLRRLAAAYLAGRDGGALAVRFDVATLGPGGEVELLEGAFS